MINCPYCENFREDRVEPEHRVTQKNRGLNHRGCQHPTSGGLNSSIPPSIFCLSALFTCLAFWTFTKQQSLCQTHVLGTFLRVQRSEQNIYQTYIKAILGFGSGEQTWLSQRSTSCCHSRNTYLKDWQTDNNTHACTHAQARAHTFHGGAVLSGIRAPLLEGQHLPLILGQLLSS